MAKSFAELRKNKKARQKKIQEKIDNEAAGGGGDDRFWKLTVDGSGNGYAVIRFMPEPPNEKDPYVKVYNHYFKGPGGYYAEKSLTTLGKGVEDPVTEYNRSIWETNEDFVRKHSKRQLSYYSNIYVVNDPAKPENNGKVFLYRYGQKIFDLIHSAANPKFDDEEPIFPFDLEDGANFKLKAMQDGDQAWNRSYAKSSFMTPGPITNSEGDEVDVDEQEKLWKSCHSLFEFINPESFKSYDELEKQLNKVMKLDTPRGGHDHEDDEIEPRKEKSRKSRYEDDSDDDEDHSVNEDEDSDEDEDLDDETAEFLRSLKDDD